MAVLSRQPWCIASVLLVPLLTLAAPGWLRLAGVAPAWAVLWLLPWALVDGSLSGGLAGLAGLIEASRLSTGQPTAGQGYELQAIAAVVIGGGSLRGGEGTVIGTLVGGFIMGLLANGSDLLGINPYVQQALIGAMIIVFVAVDELRKRRVPS